MFTIGATRMLTLLQIVGAEIIAPHRRRLWPPDHPDRCSSVSGLAYTASTLSNMTQYRCAIHLASHLRSTDADEGAMHSPH